MKKRRKITMISVEELLCKERNGNIRIRVNTSRATEIISNMEIINNMEIISSNMEVNNNTNKRSMLESYLKIQMSALRNR